MGWAAFKQWWPGFQWIIKLYPANYYVSRDFWELEYVEHIYMTLGI